MCLAAESVSVSGGVFLLWIVRPRRGKRADAGAPPLPCGPQHRPQSGSGSATDDKSIAPQRAGGIPGGGGDRHLVVPDIQGRERSGERNATVTQNPHVAGSVGRVALTHRDELAPHRNRSDAELHGHIGTGLQAWRQSFGSQRREGEDWPIQLGHGSRRVQRSPGSVGVAVDDELEKDAHGSSLAPTCFRR